MTVAGGIATDKMERLVAGNLAFTLGAIARLPSCRLFSFDESSFLLATGTKAASENWAFLPSHSLEKSKILRARSFFGELDLPFVWPVLPNAGRAYRRALEEEGLFQQGELTAMVRTARFLEKTPPPLAFEKAATKEDAALWAETAWRAFGSPPGAPASFVNVARELVTEAGFLLTTACRNGVPVGTFMLASCGLKAGIGVYYFATLPEERGRGVGSAMMDRILRIASEGTSDFPAPGFVVLQATPAGARFYASHGFDALFPIPLCSMTRDVF
ncbi:MAG: GNAT family N-acetyltransferase [Synergistaceae bacterium]|jgi:GNAT superfamily N-acetyltransferase|nr:GNAT family N-acetyltransferase [Synergistaceae bacterium]